MSNKILVSHIVWGKRNRTNFLFAGTGLLIGFVMLLLAVHLYENIYKPVNTDLKKQQLSTFLIINKKVNLGNTIGVTKSTFNDAEISKFSKQPFIKKVGAFTSNQFKAHLYLGEYGDSELPMESVEDGFLDTIPNNWQWAEGDNIVPVIVSNEFLNLYNFVLAPSWGSKQIPRNVISKINGKLQITGDGKIDEMKIKVVGFSDRIVSVIVPQTFMTWANTTYGDNKVHNANRIIAEVTDPSDKRLLAYLDNNNFETNKDKIKTNAQGIVSILIIVVSILGATILLLAVFLFLTTFKLFIAQQKDSIQLLFQLGYTVSYILKIWMRMFLIIISILTIGSCCIIYILNILIVNFATHQGLEILSSVNVIVYAIAVIFAIGIILYNGINIQRMLLKMYI